MWITHNKIYDILGILFPWLLGVLLFAPSVANTGAVLIFAFLIFGILDAGHVYTTIWRILLGKSKKLHFLWLFIGIFVFLSMWIYFQIPYFWAFVVYSTLFHHIRQYFGVLKWYQKLNMNFARYQEYALYALTIIPVIILHFRTDFVPIYYTKGDMFLYPSQTLFIAFLVVYAICGIAYLLYELKSKNTLPTILAVVSPACLYAICGLLLDDPFLILSFLILGHTIPYFTLMFLSVKRVAKYTSLISLGIILSTGILLGSFEFAIEEFIYNFAFLYQSTQLTLLNSALIGGFLTPLFSHFLFDAIVWRKKNSEMKKIVI